MLGLQAATVIQEVLSQGELYTLFVNHFLPIGT
jgi:hypothetical protein